MLRITSIDQSDKAVIFKLEGRLVGQWVTLLQNMCATHDGVGKPLALDLSAVTFASKDGVCLLRCLAQRGVECILCSPFLKTCIIRKD